MNFKPTVLSYKKSKKEISLFMRQKEYKHLPLVDENNKVKDVISLTELVKIEKKENYVVLMAGGLGARLADLTQNCPKPMLKVGGKPILETIIETFKEHGFYKFIISVNYMSNVIEEHFQDGTAFNVEIQYIKETKRLGTAGALALFKADNNLPFVVMNGDLLTKLDFTELLNFHINNQNDATMCLRRYEHQIPFGVVSVENDVISRIEEKPVRSYFVNGGIYILNPSVRELIPTNELYDMTTLFENLISKKKKTGAFPFYEYWIDIGRIDDFEKAHSEFLEIFK
jgi:NDP-sugar pyrophosphorylase family protein